jgi:hypothetical protein
MTLKEYCKIRLEQQLNEEGERRHMGGDRWQQVMPRVDETGKRWSAIMAGDKPGAEDRRPPQTPSEVRKAIDARIKRNEPVRDEVQEAERVHNLLNAVHHFSRNFGIQINKDHIKGIDFSTGTAEDHIDQISQRLA